MGLTLAERRAVTEATAIRYTLASKRGKSRILDELCANTGWHRNHARKALRTALQPRLVSPRSPPATEVRTGCHRGIDGVLDGAGNAGRQAAGTHAGRTGRSVASFRGAGHR